jgi:hypothetical protein
MLFSKKPLPWYLQLDFKSMQMHDHFFVESDYSLVNSGMMSHLLTKAKEAGRMLTYERTERGFNFWCIKIVPTARGGIADAILTELRKSSKKRMTRSDVWKKIGQGKTPDDLTNCIDDLVKSGYIRIEKENTPGRPRTWIYLAAPSQVETPLDTNNESSNNVTETQQDDSHHINIGTIGYQTEEQVAPDYWNE